MVEFSHNAVVGVLLLTMVTLIKDDQPDFTQLQAVGTFFSSDVKKYALCARLLQLPV